MADNIIPITAGSGTSVRTVTNVGVDSGAHQQVMTVSDGTGKILGTSTAAAITAPAVGVTSFTVLAANTARLGALLYNDSTVTVYLAYAATASTTAYTVQIPPGGYYELPGTPGLYTGILTGIATTAGGNLRVTELS